MLAAAAAAKRPQIMKIMADHSTHRATASFVPSMEPRLIITLTRSLRNILKVASGIITFSRLQRRIASLNINGEANFDVYSETDHRAFDRWTIGHGMW